jgi:hypothetical protein
MEMVLIKPDSAEWNYMWEWVANHPINEGFEDPSVALNPENNEAWQYMGSYRSNNRIVHEFRHRSLPITNERQYLKVSASENITDEDIEKVLSVK